MIELKFDILTPETKPGFETLFGEKGACGGCWCMYWRLTHSEFEKNKGKNNKLLMRELIKNESPLGILAYEDKTPIGWCSISPRANLKRLKTSRLFKPIDNEPVWSITCLFIKKEYRKQNVSSKLISFACNYAFKNGANIVEAYPLYPKKETMPDVFAYYGFKSSFAKAGFKEIKKCSETRLIMRKENDKNNKPIYI